MKTTAAISLCDLSVTLRGNLILERINLTIPRGEVTALIGPNGAGKTTLLLALMGLVPYRGQVCYLDETGRPQAKPRLGYIPQSLPLDPDTPLTVGDFLSLGMQRRPLWFGRSPNAERAGQIQLEMVKASRLADKPLGKLSGGELQRVLLASVLQQQPEILLFDEPMSGIDLAGEQLFCDILEEIQRQGRMTLLLVSHDLSIVTRHAQHVLCLNRTLECSGPVTEVLTQENLEKIYGSHSGLFGHRHGHAHGGRD